MREQTQKTPLYVQTAVNALALSTLESNREPKRFYPVKWYVVLFFRWQLQRRRRVQVVYPRYVEEDIVDLYSGES